MAVVTYNANECLIDKSAFSQATDVQ